MKKVCIYCRTAQDNQVELDLQIEKLKDFAKEKDLEIVKIISETGSGLDFNRKGLNEIMKIAKSKQVDMILVRDISRISRDTIFNLKFVEEIQKFAEFKTVDSFDTSENDWDEVISALPQFFSIHKKG